jgi:hypothetical protein
LKKENFAKPWVCNGFSGAVSSFREAVFSGFLRGIGVDSLV